MDTNPDHHLMVAQLQQRASGFAITSGAPLVRYVNRLTGGELITRDVKVYDRIAEWERAPMGRSHP